MHGSWLELWAVPMNPPGPDLPPRQGALPPYLPQSSSTPSPFDINHRQRQPRLQYTHKPTIPARLLDLADGSYGERLNPEGIPMSIDAGTGNPLSQPSQSGSALCCMCPVDRPMVIHMLVATTCSRWRSQCCSSQMATKPTHHYIALPTKPLGPQMLVSTACNQQIFRP